MKLQHSCVYMNLNELFTLEKLNNAFYEEAKASYWKESTQRYRANLLINNIKLQEELLNNEYEILQTHDFKISERGKIRKINAPAMRDAIVQKILNQYILLPQLGKYFIYDNYASLEGRGTSMARKRVLVMLQRHIKKYGNNGYVLQVDIKNFFGSINHATLIEMLDKKLNADNNVKNLIYYIINNSSNSDTGLNLGAEMPQTLSGFYLFELDNYIKTVLKTKFYARYADDILICVQTKEEAKQLLKQIEMKLSKINLTVSEKKTHVIKLSHGFTYLKIKYNIDDNKIITRPVHNKIQRERGRLRKYKNKCNKNELTETEVYKMYNSWKCNIVKECNHIGKTINSMDGLYNKLFAKFDNSNHKKETRDEIINKAFKENAFLLTEIGYDE